MAARILSVDPETKLPPAYVIAALGAALGSGSAAPFAGIMGAGSSISTTNPGWLGQLASVLTTKTGIVPVISRDAGGGWSTRNMREHFAESITASRPSTVTIETSVNDCRVDLGVNLAETEENLRVMIGAARLSGARPVLMTTAPVNYTVLNAGNSSPVFQPSASEARRVENNTMARALATELGILLVDLDRIFVPLSNYTDDGLHPNTYGQIVMGTSVACAILNLPNPYALPTINRTVVATDTFTRANSTTTLGTTETGSLTWDPGTKTWGVLSNAAYTVTGTLAKALLTAGSANHGIKASLTPSVGGATIGCAVRGLNEDNCIIVNIYDNLDRLQISKIVAGVITSTYVSYPIVGGTAYDLQVDAIGNTIYAYINGGLVHKLTLTTDEMSTFLGTGTKAGMYRSATGTGSGVIDTVRLETLVLAA